MLRSAFNPASRLAASRRGVLLGLGASAFSAACATRGDASASFAASQALLDRYVAEGKIAGGSIQVLGARSGFLAAGKIAVDGDVAFGADSLVRIYSMTKPITAMAAMQLIESGTMGLDQPVADFIPAFAKVQVLADPATMATRAPVRPITVRHLLTHTAGFTYHFNPNPIAKLYAKEGLTPGLRGPLEPGFGAQAPTLEAFCARLASLPLIDDPGARYEYSVSLDVLGAVIQQAAQRPFDHILQEQIFDPLGMGDTSFSAPVTKLPRMTSAYFVSPKGLVLADDGAKTPFVETTWMPSGGGGLVSTAADYAKFTAALLAEGKRLVKPETMRLARSNLLPAGVLAEGAHYGAGMSVASAESAAKSGVNPGTFGWGGAAGTLMWVDPTARFAAILMVQHFPAEAYPLREEARKAVYADLAQAKRA